MTIPLSDDTSVARMRLIVQDRSLGDVDPMILHRMILAARSAHLMPEAKATVQWGVEYDEGNYPLPNEADARASSKPLVSRERISYTSHAGPWTKVDSK